MRLQEAREAVKYLNLPISNHHPLKFHDAEGQKYVVKAVEEVKPIIKDAERIILPSNNNAHVDHQATHDIAVGAAKDLNLRDVEFWVYFIPTYGRFDKDSQHEQFEVEINDSLRERLQEWLNIYQSQKKTPLTWKLYQRYLKSMKKTRYGKYRLEDKGKYYNF